MGSVRNLQRTSMDLQGWHHFRDYAAVQTTMDELNYKLTSMLVQK